MTETTEAVLREKVDELTKLSTTPEILKRILEISEDENANASDYERVIERDIALASQILKLSNASYYGFSRKIRTISQAVMVLGFDMVKGLAISSAVFTAMSPASRDKVRELWCHSYEAANATAMLADRAGVAGRDIAFLSGLLHDIGRALFFQIFGGEYFENCPHDRADLFADEVMNYGASHTEVGAWFVDKCNLPGEIVTAIKYHHTPDVYNDADGKIPQLLSMVYLGDLIVSEDGFFKNDSFLSPEHTNALKSLGITGSSLALIKIEVEKHKDEIRQFFS